MTFWQVIESRKYNQNQKMIKSLEKFLNLESAFIGASKISHRVFLLEGVDNRIKKQGLKKHARRFIILIICHF